MCWNCGKPGHYEKDCKQKWTQNKEWSGKKGKSKGKSKGKGKMNSVENWQEGWSETGAQGDEHADGWTWSGEQAEGWWNAADDQNGSSSGQWMSANDQTAWEPEGPVGGIEMNSIEKIHQARSMGSKVVDAELRQWCSRDGTGDLPLEKRGEFRVASGAVIPNLGKIKMKLTDESGIKRTVRGNITEVAKPLLSAAEVSKRWDSLLFEERGILLERNTPVALEIRAVLAKHKVWSHRGKSIRLYREGKLYNAYVRAGDATPGACTFKWRKLTMDNVTSRMNLRINLRSSGECWPLVSSQSWRRQKHSQTNHAVFAHWCEVCVKAKGTGAQHRRQTNKELAKQEQCGPPIYSDFLYMSEGGVSTPMLALKFSRSGRMAPTALEQKGLTQYGVKFFAGIIQQTGVRMFINKSDEEPAMKALKDAAAKAHRRGREHFTRIASGRPPSKR